MAQLKTKIQLYLKANSKIWDGTKILLQDDGSGAYIKTWNIDGLAKPSDEQLASYNSAATIEENNNVIRGTRKKSYGDIGNQLDEIYKDIDAWKARIKSIKDANPKE
jgi:hypothetical protein